MCMLQKDNEGKNALTAAIINRERDCARAIIESDDWLEALNTDVPDVMGSNTPRETPLRSITIKTLLINLILNLLNYNFY